MKFASAISLLLPAVSVSALGINCEGSAKCSAIYGTPNAASDIKSAIDGIDTNRW